MATSNFGNEPAEANESQQRDASAAVPTYPGRCFEGSRDRFWADPAGRGRLRLRGMAISPGLAVGPAFIYRDLFQRDI